MDLYLQLGHGMQAHCQRLIQRWGNGTVILSLRDLKPEQIVRVADSIRDASGKVLLDPQLYEPRSTHHRLVQYDYWPDDYATDMLLGGAQLNDMLIRLRRTNNLAQTDRYIVPGLYCERFDEDWLGRVVSCARMRSSDARADNEGTAMTARYGLQDDPWARIAGSLPGRVGHVGGTARDNRLFVDAVL